MGKFKKKPHILLIVICTGIFSTGLYIAWPFTVDDAFISFRYAHNLAEGYGLVWNPGSSPVEGYTNFLWVILCAFFEKLLGSSVVPSKIIGVLFLLVLIMVVFHTVYTETGSLLIGGVSTLAILIFPPTYYHAVSGLETMLFSFLFLAIFVVGHRALMRKASSGLVLLVPTLGLLIGLTRPEGLVPAAVIFVFCVKYVRPNLRRELLLYTAVAAVLGLIYMGWRIEYFGYLLPNTFYAKTQEGSVTNIIAISEWLNKDGLILISLLSIYIFSQEFVNSYENGLYDKYVVTVVTSLGIVYMLIHPSMNYLYRFIYPIILLIIMCQIISIGNNSIESYSAKFYFAIALYLSFIMVSTPFHSLANIGVYGYSLENAHVRLGKKLRKIRVPEKVRTLALEDAGAIPYYSQWYSYDLRGLNSEFVAHKGSPGGLVDIKNPSLIINNSRKTGKEELGYRGAKKRYKYVCDVSYSAYYLKVYIKRSLDRRYKDKIVNAVDNICKESKVKKRYKPKDILEFLFNRTAEIL